MRIDPRIRIVAASRAHIGPIANRMREDDRTESAAKGRAPKSALRASLAHSTWACTVLIDDRPEAMFGVVGACLLSDKGRPWFLGTDEVYRHPRDLLWRGANAVHKMRGDFRRLENVVSVANVRAIRMLRRWGFTIESDVQVFGGVPFVAFWSEADV